MLDVPSMFSIQNSTATQFERREHSIGLHREILNEALISVRVITFMTECRDR